MIKACIFDLDGTLADTLDSMAYVTNIIMEKFGLKTLPVDNFRYYSGEGANMLIRRALKDAGDPELAHYDEGQKLYREMFEADPMYKVVPYKGMPETLKKLKKHGMKLAVCSNKPHPAAVKVIAQLFDGEFDMDPDARQTTALSVPKILCVSSAMIFPVCGNQLVKKPSPSAPKSPRRCPIQAFSCALSEVL